MTGALAIFAKTPGLSPVKTRLAAGIGIEKANQFYEYSVKCLEELALTIFRETNGELIPYWAIGEQDGLEHPLWEKLDRIWTGAGGLGDRLDNIYAMLLGKHDHVILIGTDSPHLQSAVVLEAHAHLKRKEGYILGPAEDGGYYLYGGHTRLPREAWLSVPYSVPETCGVFAEKLALFGRLTYIEKNFDVDTQSDLKKLRACTSIMKSPAQIVLMNWMKEEEQARNAAV
jgi:uncharacterized protein